MTTTTLTALDLLADRLVLGSARDGGSPLTTDPLLALVGERVVADLLGQAASWDRAQADAVSESQRQSCDAFAATCRQAADRVRTLCGLNGGSTEPDLLTAVADEIRRASRVAIAFGGGIEDIAREALAAAGERLAAALDERRAAYQQAIDSFPHGSSRVADLLRWEAARDAVATDATLVRRLCGSPSPAGDRSA